LLENLAVLSRGQLKLLAVGLLPAQSHAISKADTKRGIIAITATYDGMMEYPNNSNIWKQDD